MKPQVEWQQPARGDEDGSSVWRKTLPAVGAMALLLGGSVLYLLWKRLRGRGESPREADVRRTGPTAAERVHGERRTAPQQTADRRTPAGANLLLIVLVCLVVLGGCAFGALLFFDRLPASIADSLPELAFFDDGVLGVFESEPAPIPVLQEASSEERQRQAALERERLNSYGWVSREANIVHIPLERAMELAVERGLPDR